MQNIPQRRTTFRRLHESGCFVIPNPWDVGSAIALEKLGFKALASTSAGLAFSLGLPDSPLALPRQAVLDHLAAIVAATNIPVNADFQSGYATNPEGVHESVRLCCATGVAGLSIEDSTGDPRHPLFDEAEALRRLSAAREAIDADGRDVLLTARCEAYLVGHPNPLEESLRRLKAYAEAGADALFAPGVKTKEDIRAIVQAVAPKPINVLMSAPSDLRVSDLAALGVRRISVGSALARVAWGAFLRAANQIKGEGTFTTFEQAAPFADLNNMFG